MKKYTEQEIETKVKELWDDEFAYSYNGKRLEVVEPPQIEVYIKNDTVRLTIKKMYERPGLSFAKLKALSEFFETENINDPDNFGHGGCETCDYGSCYGFTLEIKP